MLHRQSEAYAAVMMEMNVMSSGSTDGPKTAAVRQCAVLPDAHEAKRGHVCFYFVLLRRIFV